LSSPAVSTLATSHSVTLTGLAAGTTYDFAVVSTPSGGTAVTSTNYSLATLASAMVISNVQTSAISSSGATITWTTSVAASSQVVYGTTAAYGLSSPAVSTLATSHSVTLTGLAAGTTYDFAVVSTPSGGTAVTSTNYSLATLAGAMVISNVQLSGITSSGATMTWTTSVAASSQVVYGTSTGYGSTSPVVATMATSHSVTLTGLAAGTTYDCAAVSTPSGGQAITSSNYSFATLASSSSGTPVISNVQAVNVTATGATITWTTSVAASSEVVYGTNTPWGGLNEFSPAAVTLHSMTLSGLSPSTKYRFAVEGDNATGSWAVSSIYSFTTIAGVSEPALAISNVQATAISATGATITWTTTLPSSSEVVYGTTTPWGGLNVFSPNLVTAHSMTLSGLSPSTKYVFAVEGDGSTGPWVVSSIYSFTTIASAVTTSAAPVISNVQASAVSNTSATITWTTDRPSTSLVVYGTSTPWGGPQSPYSPTLTTTHSVALDNLTPGLPYVFAVEGVGASGPWAISPIYSLGTETASVSDPSGIGLPGSSPPGIGQPGVGQPGNGPPGSGQPGIGQPCIGQPGNGPPGSGQPGIGQPCIGQPGSAGGLN